MVEMSFVMIRTGSHYVLTVLTLRNGSWPQAPCRDRSGAHRTDTFRTKGAQLTTVRHVHVLVVYAVCDYEKHIALILYGVSAKASTHSVDGVIFYTP